MSQVLADLAVPLAGGIFVATLEIQRHLGATGGAMWWFDLRMAVQDRLERRRAAKARARW